MLSALLNPLALNEILQLVTAILSSIEFTLHVGGKYKHKNSLKLDKKK